MTLQSPKSVTEVAHAVVAAFLSRRGIAQEDAARDWLWRVLWDECLEKDPPKFVAMLKELASLDASDTAASYRYNTYDHSYRLALEFANIYGVERLGYLVREMRKEHREGNEPPTYHRSVYWPLAQRVVAELARVSLQKRWPRAAPEDITQALMLLTNRVFPEPQLVKYPWTYMDRWVKQFKPNDGDNPGLHGMAYEGLRALFREGGDKEMAARIADAQFSCPVWTQVLSADWWGG